MNKHLNVTIFVRALISDITQRVSQDNNVQKIKVGDIVILHDDTPRVNLKLAVIQQVIKGKDGVI